ncbi:MAG TPA: fructosamine kinase family protein [Thiobacillaceae bacterium]|nr:fructosamine kinase family protein [Thiobacillaceae bacterium]
MSAFDVELGRAIGRALGETFALRHGSALHGGDTSEARRVGDGVCSFFVKTQPAARLAMFEAEAAGLAELAAADAVRVPQVICHGVAAGRAYLVLEDLPLQAHGDAAALGRALAQQHRVTSTRFGWRQDNWIGATAQPNPWQADWVRFWQEARLGFQLRLAARNGHGGALQRDGETLLAGLGAILADHAPAPSLLHGDLWGGNHGYLGDGSPVIFDPAPYFGDRECDIAMTELFGGFAPAFHAAYRDAWPLDAGYPVRRMLYNLYHVLNHANMFGGGYVGQAHRLIQQLLAQMR